MKAYIYVLFLGAQLQTYFSYHFMYYFVNFWSDNNWVIHHWIHYHLLAMVHSSRKILSAYFKMSTPS